MFSRATRTRATIVGVGSRAYPGQGNPGRGNHRRGRSPCLPRAGAILAGATRTGATTESCPYKNRRSAPIRQRGISQSEGGMRASTGMGKFLDTGTGNLMLPYANSIITIINSYYCISTYSNIFL